MKMGNHRINTVSCTEQRALRLSCTNTLTVNSLIEPSNLVHYTLHSTCPALLLRTHTVASKSCNSRVILTQLVSSVQSFSSLVSENTVLDSTEASSLALIERNEPARLCLHVLLPFLACSSLQLVGSTAAEARGS
mmetsp:Transcript_56626/g.93957  ORF Transcript_56626/g.93957 Transcript_56626/m.93957 type:complete len:135 (+) Transcript_56626:30-434(+)